jgi:hypothetical protein
MSGAPIRRQIARIDMIAVGEQDRIARFVASIRTV